MDKKKILIIDDEDGFTRMVKLNLEATGRFEVRNENKAAEGLSAAKAFRPDLIFLDIVMPDIEGSEVANQIKADKNLKDIPIIYLTATVTSDEVDLEGGKIGGQSFLPKPVTVKQMVVCIENNIGK